MAGEVYRRNKRQINGNMKLRNKIFDEWERGLLYASVAFAIFAVLYLVLSLVHKKDDMIPLSTNVPNLKSYLNRNAFAFMHEPIASDKIADPFRNSKVLAKYEQKMIPQTTQMTKTPLAPPPKPKKFRTVSYSGWIDSSDGRKLVFLNVLDDSSKKKISFSVFVDDEFDCFSLTKVGEDEIVFTDKKQKKYSVKIRSEKKVEIE